LNTVLHILYWSHLRVYSKSELRSIDERLARIFLKGASWFQFFAPIK
jgi:hypothetical protein